MTAFNITIISDNVCPWCYIGYRKLQSAISQHLAEHPSDTFAIQWQPFQLNPHAPRGTSVDKRTSYEQRLGVEQTQLVFERLRSAAKGTGIKFSFKGRTGSTLDSHRLIEYVGQKDSEAADGRSFLKIQLVEELFADYFERGRDITSQDVLARAASRAGLDEHEIKAFLASDALVKEVEQKARENRAEVNSVPFFSINGVFTVEGAQEPAAFLMLFKRLKVREQRNKL